MSEQDKTVQEELREAIWSWGQRIVVTLVLFGAGYLGGWFQWGDAAELRQQKKQLEDQIVDLKNQRETLSTRIAREQRDKEVCRKELDEVKKLAPAAPADGAGG
jgi:cell division protein FtsB